MTKNEEKWLANYESFRTYVMSNAKMPGSAVKSSIGTSLEGWYRNQKDKYNEGKLGKNEVFLFNRVVPGMLEKSVQEINLELYLRYRKCLYDKYNPEVVHLYRKCAIDYSFAKECIARGKYTLVDILQSYKNPDELLHHCLKAIYGLPNMSICQLYCYIIGEKGIFELYLKDNHRFIDYYVVVLNNFNNDYNKIEDGRAVLRKGSSTVDLSTFSSVFDLDVAFLNLKNLLKSNIECVVFVPKKLYLGLSKGYYKDSKNDIGKVRVLLGV